MPFRQFALPAIPHQAGPDVAIVADLPFDLRQQFAAKNSNDFRLLLVFRELTWSADRYKE
jgi:hypothetical protein